MNLQRIHQDNWTHCHFVQGQLHAYLAYGAGPTAEGGVEELYYLNLTQGHEEDGQVLLSEIFHDLTEALAELNHRYAHFEFKDLSVASDGCGSCQAH